MAAVVAGGREALRRRPVMGTIIGIVSPLTHDRETLEAMVEYASLGLPIILGGMTQVGATGPITIAGTMALHNAEILSGVVNTQAINPGTPVMYGSVSGIFDMRTCSYSYGAIEDGLFQVGFAQLAHFYQLPTRADCGQTDSKVLDMQAGFEGVQATLLAALSGHDFLYGAVLGSVESTGTYSYEKALIQHEIAGGISRLLKGITVDRDTLAVDLIDKVGPGGHYFDQEHTMKYLRVEQFIPELASRKGYWRWAQDGKQTMTDRAREAVEHILETHCVQPLDEYMESELKKIVKSIEAREESPG